MDSQRETDLEKQALQRIRRQCINRKFRQNEKQKWQTLEQQKHSLEQENEDLKQQRLALEQDRAILAVEVETLAAGIMNPRGHELLSSFLNAPRMSNGLELFKEDAEGIIASLEPDQTVLPNDSHLLLPPQDSPDLAFERLPHYSILMSPKSSSAPPSSSEGNYGISDLDQCYLQAAGPYSGITIPTVSPCVDNPANTAFGILQDLSVTLPAGPAFDMNHSSPYPTINAETKTAARTAQQSSLPLPSLLIHRLRRPSIQNRSLSYDK